MVEPRREKKSQSLRFTSIIEFMLIRISLLAGTTLLPSESPSTPYFHVPLFDLPYSPRRKLTTFPFPLFANLARESPFVPLPSLYRVDRD